MPNILIHPKSGILEFNTGSASGSAFDTSLSGAARLKFQNSGELNLTSLGTGVADKLTIDGSNGRLLTVNNTVTGSIFSVNDVAGLPIVEVFSDDRVVMGQYATDALVVSGSGVSFAHLPTVSGNPFITGFAEGDTLQTVTDRGATTTNTLSLNDGVSVTDSVHPIILNRTDGSSALINLQTQGGSRGFLGASSTDAFNVWNSTPTRLFTVLNGGNVGIGSATPAYKLDVVDSDGGTLARFKDSDSSHAGLIIQGDTNGGSITNNTAFTSEVIYLQNSANAMRFYTDGTEAVRIDSSQRVGIGTNSVNGFTHINGRMDVEGPAVPSILAISDSGDATKCLRMGFNTGWDAGSISASDFGAGWKDIVIAPHAGKVGIGTTSPHQALSVKGTIVAYNSSYVQVAGMTNSSNHGRLYANNSAGVTKVLLESDGESYLNGGFVGINDSTPTNMLSVSGDASNQTAVAKITRQQASASNNTYTFEVDSSAHTSNMTAGGAMAVDVNAGRAFTINGNGRVGIANDNPGHALDVSGDAAFAQYLYHQGDEDTNIKFVDDDILFNVGGATFLRLQENGLQNQVLINSDTEDTDFIVYGNNTNPAIFVRGSDREVGINTSNPTASFHVVGNARIKGASSDGVLMVENAAGSQVLRIDQNSIRTTTNNNLTFLTNGNSNSLVLQQSSNYLGIGAVPTSPLHLSAIAVGRADGSAVTTMTKTIATSTIGAKLGFTGGNNSNNNIIGGLSMGNVGEEYAGMYAVDGGASATTHLAFFAGNSTSTNEGMRLLSDGKVGIGTTNPGSKIDIVTASNTNGIMVKSATDGSNVFNQFIDSSDNGHLWLYPDGGNANIKLNTAGDTFFNGGDVGIGTSNPSQKLNVSGGHILIDNQDPQIQFNDTDGSTYTASWMYQNNAIKFVWGGGHKFKVDSAGGMTLGQSFSSNETAPSKGIIMEGRLGVGTSGVGQASLYVADLTSETNGKVIISGTGTSTPAADLYVYGSGNADVINAVRDRNDASIKVTSTTAGAYFRTNSATSTYNGIDLNQNWFIGQYGHNDLRIVDGTASAGDSAAAITVQNSTKNVGIGTTNPSSALTVVGDGSDAVLINDGYVRIKDTSTNDAIQIQASVGNEARIFAGNFDLTQAHPLKIAGDAIRFTTSGAGATNEVMRLTAEGKVGIGTNTPAAFLDVSRDNNNVGNQLVVADTEGASAAIRTYTTSSPAGLILNHYYAEAGSSNEYARYADFVSNVGNGAGTKMRFITKNAANTYFTGLLIDNSGNIGIGTDDPTTARLRIKGTTNDNSTLALQCVDSTDTQTFFVRNDGVVQVTDNYFYVSSNAGAYVQNDLRVRGSLSNDGGALVVGGDVNFDVNTLFVDSTNDRVGIGTNDPNKQVEIRATEPYLRLEEGDSGGNKRLDLFVSNSTGVIGANQSAQTMMFQTVGETRMTIASDGKVGIGVTAPIKELQVDGSILGKNNGGYLQYDAQGNVATILNLTTANELSIGQASHVDSMSFNVGGGDDRIFINSDGNVGIGTSTMHTGARLTVQANNENVIATGLVINSYQSTTATAGNGVGIVMGQNNGIYSSKIANVWTNNNPSYLQTNIAFYTMHDSYLAGSETEKMRLTSRGRLGIGTDAPDNQLHVETSDNEVAKFESTDAKGYIEIKDNNYSSYVGINSTAGAASFGGKTDGAADTGNLNISTINGKVGIGTTAFSEQLGVKPDTDVSAEIGKAHVGYIGYADYAGFSHVDKNSTTTYALLQSAGGSTFLNKANGYEIYFRNNNSTIGGFNTANDFYVNTDTLYVDVSTDRVAINNTSPSGTLDLVGTYRIADNTTNSNNKLHRMLGRHYNNSELDVNIFSSISTSSTNFISFGGGSSSFNQATTIAFYTSNDNTSPWDGSSNAVERMRVTNEGRVGIGTQSPGYKLEVNGSIVGTSKSFVIDHPTQTGKKLMHACIEGPENGVYFRGKSQDSGIQAPEYWSGLVDIDSMTVDVTPIGPNQSIYVDRIEDNGDVYVGANTNEPLNYFYVIYGERKDIDKLEIVKDAPPPLEDESDIHQ
jgi:hypothetical protein